MVFFLANRHDSELTETDRLRLYGTFFGNYDRKFLFDFDVLY